MKNPRGLLARWWSGLDLHIQKNIQYYPTRSRSSPVRETIVSLSDSDQIIQSESSAGTFNYDIGVTQDIQYGDARLTNGNNYRIVITFTGSTP